MADVSMRELVGILHVKALELSGRAAALADHVADANPHEIEFVLAMIEESERAVSFWAGEIKKAARK